jgi:hypothetical protein
MPLYRYRVNLYFLIIYRQVTTYGKLKHYEIDFENSLYFKLQAAAV